MNHMDFVPGTSFFRSERVFLEIIALLNSFLTSQAAGLLQLFHVLKGFESSFWCHFPFDMKL